MANPPETVAELLEQARAIGVKQREIATELGVAERTVRRWYANDGDMRLSSYRKLLEFLRQAKRRQA